ncbi:MULTISPECIES: LysR substrate-binding domain-containing protein [Hydrocarboniphaga]|uniref:HTH lysR-type domain-containing protein n=1 Tax=Hydrocarboniphaga effusa AP103 TaxID=1172194 RepID=I8TBI4_9GAMM|nr:MULTISPECIES: LysR substrate-binding domain-containing protein [Hydrocarboniphaga]EIT71205.1 hypothetical protein WQQ_13420 [Hydrocarboniphaga effusa AP103]MDZ4079440.1 LysR substrate-binding domain-containing protein [Hydrocarboniphaga sp.]
MSTPITLRQLEIFLAVAGSGHVTRASQTLHLSQSAASMAIAQLERQLDTPLFERRGRSLKLTERGRLLATEARELLARVQALPTLLSGAGEALRGELRITASQTAGCYLLAPAIAAFARAHPQTRVHCHIGNTAVAVQSLLAHEADVGYVEGRVSQPDIVAMPWRRDRLEIVVGREGPQPRRKLDASQLRKLPWIMREPGSGTRELFDQAVRTAGLDPLPATQTFNDAEAVKEAVIQGFGAACLPVLAIADDLREGRLIALQAPMLTLERQLWRITRRGSFDGAVLSAFETWLQSQQQQQPQSLSARSAATPASPRRPRSARS